MSARVANSVLLTIRMPASATWSTSACEPITNAAPPVAALREHELERRAAGHDLVDARLEAEPPELAHELLRRVADVVGEERDPLAGLAQRGDRLGRAVDAPLADPEAAVEVEQHVVVAASAGVSVTAAIIIAADAAAADAPRSLLLVLAVAGCGGDDDEQCSGGDTAAAGRRPRRRRPRTPAASRARAASRSTSRRPRSASSPSRSERLDPAKTYVATVKTNCGEFEITLDAKRAPKTGGSFKYLADKGFYDGPTSTASSPGFVIQGGDPKGDGTGGPGLLGRRGAARGPRLHKGVVAMAKTRSRTPGTSGSQFFVVTGDGASLPPDYALLGKVTKGQDVVDLIGVAPVGPRRAAGRPIVMRVGEGQRSR